MVSWKRTGKLNVKVLAVLLLVVAAIGVSLFAARHVRRRVLSRMDLNAGQLAYKNKDWPAAHKHFQEYLGRNPDDIEILKKYAEARMNAPAPNAGHIFGAISAYRRVIQVDPLDETAYEQLAKLYTYIGSFDELKYIAGKRLENAPDDKKAPLWLATALFRLDKIDDPRDPNDPAVAALRGYMEKLDAAKHPEEYVQACTLRSQIILSDDSDDSEQARRARAKDALGFLTQAVEKVPASAEALVTRARFYRGTSDIPGVTSEDRIVAARADLVAADKLGAEDPAVRSALCAEWIAHGDPNRADAELQAVENLGREVIDEHFLDVNDWVATRFILKSQVARQNGNAADANSLATEVLGALRDKRHRLSVLEPAVLSFVAAGNAVDANSCLDEYVDATRGMGLTTQQRLGLAYLRALVARTQNRPYAVIDVLRPVLLDDVRDYRLWLLLGEAYRMTNQSSRAITALTRYLQLRPQDPQATLQLAQEYLKQRDWNMVFQKAQLAESLDPNNVGAALLRIEAGARVAARGEQTDTARLKELSDELTALQQRHPERADIRTLQAIIEVYLGQPGKAEEELKRAVEQSEDPEKLRAEMQLARYYYGVNNIDKAIAACEAARDRRPDLAEPWLLLADLHTANADPNSARGTLQNGLEKVTGADGKRALSMKLVSLELMQGNRSAARTILEDLRKQDKQDVRALSMLLSLPEVRENKTEAEAILEELKKAEGDSGFLWRFHEASLWLASDDWRSKQRDIAEALRYCIDADPKWQPPVLLLGEMYKRIPDLQNAENLYRRSLARNPAAIDVAGVLIALLQGQNRISDAQELLKQINLSQLRPDAVSDLKVRLALGSRDYSQAIEELESRVLDDSDASSRILLARLVYLQGKNAQLAQQYLQEAKDIDPNSMALIAAEAAILKAEGKGEEARRVLDDFVAGGGGFGAYALRAAYLADEGDLEAAEKDYEKLTTFADQGPLGYGLLSNFYIANQDLDKAVETLEKGLDAHPQDSSLERALMKTLFRRDRGQDRQRGLEILGRLEEASPRDIELMKIRAVRLLEDGTLESVDAAKARLERVIEREPTAVDAHLMLINTAIRRGDYETARNLTIRALGSNPDNAALLSARSRAERLAGNTLVATQFARSALEKDPNSADALGALVELALGSKQQTLLEECRTHIDSALARNPADERMLLWRAHVLTSLEEPATAIPELEAYCQSTQGSLSVAAVVTLAELYRLAGDQEKAEQRIEQAERLDPNSQTVVHARCMWLVGQKSYDQLDQISSRYIAADGQNPSTLVTAASILSAQDSPKLKGEGIKLFEHAISLSPQMTSARLGLASTLYRTGDADRAKQIYEELRKEYGNKYPENVRIHNDLAWILQENDRNYAAALDLANQGLNAARNDNDKLHLLDTRGTILVKMNRLPEAKADFERLVALSPPDSPRMAKALLQLGRVCIKLNGLDQAKEYMRKASEIDRKVTVFTPEERSEIDEVIQR